jgi:gliding motility-associated-like protein
MLKPILTAVLCFTTGLVFSQYTVNGNASQNSCRCYTLTQALGTQSGSVWNNIKIDLNNSFDFVFDVNLGTGDSPGADGIAFVMQPISTSVGTGGSGLGFLGISPSIGVTLDTYQNSSPDNDPFFDHIAIQRNGDLNHLSTNNLVGPVQASSTSTNIEDGVNHKLRVVWNAVTKTLTAYFDNIQRVSVINDLVNTTFGGNPLVYWGFTGSTGGEFNLQSFCTALSPAWVNPPAQKRCINEPIQFTSTTISFAPVIKTYWTFGDGPFIDSVNLNPIHTYTTAGTYTVIQRVLGADGCEETNTQTITIGSKPVANFTFSDSCVGNTVQFTSTASNTVGTINSWYWDFDNGGATASIANPTSTYTTPGIKNVRFYVESDLGCGSDTLVKPIRLYARPTVDFTFTDSVCLGTPTSFNGQLLSSSDPISNWNWDFGGGNTASTQNTSFTFSTPGNHNVSLTASSTSATGCLSPVITKNVFVVDKPRAAIKAFTGCQAANVQLLDSSYTLDGLPITAWWWNLGNSQTSTQQNPTTIYNTPGTISIQLVVWNSKGCKSDTLNTTITVGAKPVAAFTISDSCINNSIIFTDISTTATGTINGWYWFLDNTGQTSTQQNPTSTYSTPGIKNIKFVAISSQGCSSDTLFKPIRIYDRPLIDFTYTDSVCLGTSINFNGVVVSSANPVVSWSWNFGGSNTANTQNTTHTFTTPGNHTVTLQASTTGAASCQSNLIQKNVFIVDKPRAAIKKFVGCQSVATQIMDSSYTLDGLPITAWWWDLGNSQFSTQQNPSVNYATTGMVNIQLVVWNSKGCRSDTLKTSIKVYASPIADFSFSTPQCNSQSIQFTDLTNPADTTITGWSWTNNSSVFSTQQHPAQVFPVGNNSVTLVATSAAGCVSAPVTKSFVIKTKPMVAANFQDACKFADVIFSASETTTAIGITSWTWNFGDGTAPVQGNPVTHAYTNNGAYTVSLYGISTEGCSSDTIRSTINIYGTNANAGMDVIAAPNQPVQLNASGGISYEWTPTTGLSNANIPNPVATNATDITYYLRAFTPEGCESFDTLQVKIYKGPDIYVPTGFTPNGDGTNDIFRIRAVGITGFEYLSVFNRYGEEVFRTSDPNRGWDGRVKGKEQHTGSFVWIVSARDYLGNKIFKKGTVLLIR